MAQLKDLIVNGNTRLVGNVAVNTLHIKSTEDAAIAKDNDKAGLKIGNLSGEHISIDGNEIIASNNGSTSTLYLNAKGGNVAVGSTLTAGSSLTATSFNVSSARKFKENIHPTNHPGLSTINKAEVVDYNYIADTNKDPKVGLIADDCPAILAAPDRMSLDMNNCIGVLMKAVQELSEQNKELTRRIEILEEKVK